MLARSPHMHTGFCILSMAQCIRIHRSSLINKTTTTKQSTKDKAAKNVERKIITTTAAATTMATGDGSNTTRTPFMIHINIIDALNKFIRLLNSAMLSNFFHSAAAYETFWKWNETKQNRNEMKKMREAECKGKTTLIFLCFVIQFTVGMWTCANETLFKAHLFKWNSGINILRTQSIKSHVSHVCACKCGLWVFSSVGLSIIQRYGLVKRHRFALISMIWFLLWFLFRFSI